MILTLKSFVKQGGSSVTFPLELPPATGVGYSLGGQQSGVVRNFWNTMATAGLFRFHLRASVVHTPEARQVTFTKVGVANGPAYDNIGKLISKHFTEKLARYAGYLRNLPKFEVVQSDDDQYSHQFVLTLPPRWHFYTDDKDVLRVWGFNKYSKNVEGRYGYFNRSSGKTNEYRSDKFALRDSPVWSPAETETPASCKFSLEMDKKLAIVNRESPTEPNYAKAKSLLTDMLNEATTSLGLLVPLVVTAVGDTLKFSVANVPQDGLDGVAMSLIMGAGADLIGVRPGTAMMFPASVAESYTFEPTPRFGTPLDDHFPIHVVMEGSGSTNSVVTSKGELSLLAVVTDNNRVSVAPSQVYQMSGTRLTVHFLDKNLNRFVMNEPANIYMVVELKP